MLLNCAVEEDSWKSLRLQGDQPVNPKGNQSWIFTGRTHAEALILWSPDANSRLNWKRHWCWERLKAGGEGDDRGRVGKWILCWFVCLLSLPPQSILLLSPVWLHPPPVPQKCIILATEPAGLIAFVQWDYQMKRTNDNRRIRVIFSRFPPTASQEASQLKCKHACPPQWPQVCFSDF